MPNFHQLSLMFCLGLLATIGHFFFIEALKVINASFAAPFVYLTVLLAAFWGFFIYNLKCNDLLFLFLFIPIV